MTTSSGTSRPRYPLEFDRTEDMAGETREIETLAESAAVDQRIMDLKLPPDVLVLLIRRDSRFLVPRGQTRLKPNDTPLVLAEPESLRAAQKTLESRDERR